MPTERNREGSLLTAEDFFKLTPPETSRYELLDGELVVTSNPTLWHQELAKRLLLLFVPLEARKLGFVWWGVDVVLSDRDVLEPDLVFVRTERLGIRQRHALVGAPDLAVEVLSPSTRKRDEQIKTKIYARAGVRTLWIVDPDDDRLDVYRLRTRAYGRPTSHRAPEVFRDESLPGLEVDLAALFTRF